jgi:dCMP deaminase
MNERIIGGTGTRPIWDEVWMDMARIVGQRSKCDRDKVGAVIVPIGNGEGFTASYNGPPAEWPAAAGEGSCLDWCDRAQPGRTLLQNDYSDCPSLHAEQNAITRADFSKIHGGTVYVTSSVCFTCAKLIANSGMKRVVMMVKQDQEHRNPQMTIEFLTTSGLGVEVWQSGYGVKKIRLSYGSGQIATGPTEIGTYGSQLGW